MEKKITIQSKIKENAKTRITVFNTGNRIKEQDLTRIWNRF